MSSDHMTAIFSFGGRVIGLQGIGMRESSLIQGSELKYVSMNKSNPEREVEIGPLVGMILQDG